MIARTRHKGKSEISQRVRRCLCRFLGNVLGGSGKRQLADGRYI